LIVAGLIFYQIFLPKKKKTIQKLLAIICFTLLDDVFIALKRVYVLQQENLVVKAGTTDVTKQLDESDTVQTITGHTHNPNRHKRHLSYRSNNNRA